MTDEQSIIVALLEYPDDWVTRSALADWCDDNDQPVRADRIRSRLTMPFAPALPCSICHGQGVVRFQQDQHGFRDVVAYRREYEGGIERYNSYVQCPHCRGEKTVAIPHSREWLLGLDGVGERWLASHLEALRAMLNRKDAAGFPVPPPPPAS